MSELQAATDLREWSPPRTTSLPALDLVRLLGVLVVPGIVIASLLGFFLGWAAAVIGLVAYSGFVWLWLSTQGRRALRSSRAAPAERAEAPRLFNLAHGMADDLGIARPGVWLAPEDEPNAMVCRGGGPLLVVSRGLLDTYTRTELEAVVAHCLVRLDHKELRRAALGAAMGRLAGRMGGSDLVAVDARAAALTRYPVGLASAISKATTKSGLGAAFWFVPQGGGWPSQNQRAARLNDL